MRCIGVSVARDVADHHGAESLVAMRSKLAQEPRQVAEMVLRRSVRRTRFARRNVSP